MVRKPPRKPPPLRPGGSAGGPPAHNPTIRLLVDSVADDRESPPEHFVRLYYALAEKAEVAYLGAKRLGLRDFIISAIIYDPVLDPEQLEILEEMRPGSSSILDEAKEKGRALACLFTRGREEDYRVLLERHPGEQATLMLSRPADPGLFVLLIQSHRGFYAFKTHDPEVEA